MSTTTTEVRPGGTAWQRAWEDALESLDLDLDRTESLLRGLHAEAAMPSVAEVTASRWTPPTGLGPIPAPLVDRARALLDRQREVGLRLAEAAHANRRQAQAAAAMRTSGPAAAAYVDVAM